MMQTSKMQFNGKYTQVDIIKIHYLMKNLGRCVNGLINNSGQICFAASRVYVQDSIYDKFLAAYRKAVAAKRKVMGDPESSSSEIGPVVDQAQYERILRIIKTARENNDGKLLQGGEALGAKVCRTPIPEAESLFLTYCT